MPADIIGGLITFLETSQGLNFWDGEVQRQDPDGTAITPDAGSPYWPACNVELPEGQMKREYAFLGPNNVRAYSEEGIITVFIWDVTREGVQAALNSLEESLESEAVWRTIDLNGGVSGPYSFIKFICIGWTNVLEKDTRAGMSQLLYRGEFSYEIGVHGNTQG